MIRKEKERNNSLLATNTFEDSSEEKAKVGHGNVSFVFWFGKDIK
jgi:hypothetical protein